MSNKVLPFNGGFKKNVRFIRTDLQTTASKSVHITVNFVFSFCILISPSINPFYEGFFKVPRERIHQVKVLFANLLQRMPKLNMIYTLLQYYID